MAEEEYKIQSPECGRRLSAPIPPSLRKSDRAWLRAPRPGTVFFVPSCLCVSAVKFSFRVLVVRGLACLGARTNSTLEPFEE